MFQDRDVFAKAVREQAAPDVAKMGIEILSFTIKDVYDNVTYLQSLGKAQTAAVKRDAEIGVAQVPAAALLCCIQFCLIASQFLIILKGKCQFTKSTIKFIKLATNMILFSKSLFITKLGRKSCSKQH